ncbi:hypothetical protein [Leisingera methylohalidivorans]|uniref:Uncharacterized protein n=1 Tax=Leisingera methylohalidivorans DSM 14336 TaxID=999552 RepID=V9VVY1_9RHOB|nr:hypothetical protein [Leisingera methylohalidivorans]AHD02906.1 hypothetical protein METH_05480 [Leisingera methylohalidivorans DSM 14336]
MPGAARWLRAVSGVMISASALVFWAWTSGAGQAAEDQPVWFTLTALRFLWLPFRSGAGLRPAVRPPARQPLTRQPLTRQPLTRQT